MNELKVKMESKDQQIEFLERSLIAKDNCENTLKRKSKKLEKEKQ